MSSTLSNVQFQLLFSSNISSDILSDGVVTHNPTIQRPVIGSGTNQVNKEFQENIVINSGSPLDLDLTALTDPTGAAISFGKLLCFVVENKGGVGNLSIGGGSNPVWSSADPKAITPGSFIFHQDMNPGVTIDSSHKTFRISCSSGSSSAKITFLGR